MPPVLLNPYRYAAAGGGSYLTTVLADSPMVLYMLDEASGTSAADSSGGGHSGTIVGTVGYRAPGPTGLTYAMGLTNTNSYVDVDQGAGTWLNIGGAGSIETWFYTTSSGDLNIAGRSSSSGYFMLDIDSANLLRFYLTTSGGTTICSATVSGLRDGNWHHIVGTYDGTNMRLYADKVLKQTTAKTGTVLTSIGDFRLGRRYDDVTTILPHRQAAAALYGSALSSTRIAAHYDAAA